VVWRDNAVVTNHHVVAHTRGQVRVLLPDGREFDAQVTAQNAALDLALLEVDAGDLPVAPVGDSSRLRVGELVFAIGHPWGQPWIVTAGIVSGLGAVPVGRGDRTAQYIRTDVRLGPGNSGGPLLSARGEVVGINAMIFGGDLAVAIPSHVARQWVAGRPGRRVVLGVQVQQVDFPPAARQGHLAGHAVGLLLVAIEPGSLAERAGLLVGDVLLEAGAAPMEDVDALGDALSNGADTLPLRLLRAGAVQELDVRLDPAEPQK
jgi:serine protease Do